MKANGEPDIIDFEYSAKPKRFRLEPDTFEACPDLPVDLLAFVSAFKGLNTNDPNLIETLLEFFDTILFDQSAARFRERVHSKENNIGVMTMMKIIPRLLEAYGLRPTQPSSDSLVPSTDETGTNSTAGVPSETSTPSDSGSLASSI